MDANGKPGCREWLRRVIFQSDTRAGQAYDVVLLVVIALSVLTVMLESVEEISGPRRGLFTVLEWVFTGLFTLEYAVRLAVVDRPGRYAGSFLGVIDLVSILPAWLELVLPGSRFLTVIRVLRLMRMFRVLRMAQYLGEASLLLNALGASRRKILIFFTAVLTLVLVEGTAVYVLENGENPGFRNIPQAIYWAIVTITTVGYGDVAPVTVGGKIMASFIMLTGFAIIAVPTGIVTSEIGREMQRSRVRRRCAQCGWEDHDVRARYCHQCGIGLE
ncbi:MAG: voltage-gated potassium channel [Verrucomicrobia bacterium]|nr:MAG: voltage-gated potassium channel [Verrucomicrobiota bacterium]